MQVYTMYTVHRCTLDFEGVQDTVHSFDGQDIMYTVHLQDIGVQDTVHGQSGVYEHALAALASRRGHATDKPHIPLGQRVDFTLEVLKKLVVM